MSRQAVKVSIIVPAYREADNLPTLIERVFAIVASADLDAEMVIVDDNSADGSVEIVERLSQSHPVRIMVRTEERGLSSAVLAGFEAATGDVFVVMDADMQHPPQAIPKLVGCITSGQADFALGSRSAPGGSVAGQWPWTRRLNSWVATVLARPLTAVSDPMSGFFALHRDTWKRATHLNPLGYKIGLELMVKARCRQCVEVPIRFQTRLAGQSKISLREQWRYLRHLYRLYRFRLLGR